MSTFIKIPIQIHILFIPNGQCTFDTFVNLVNFPTRVTHNNNNSSNIDNVFTLSILYYLIFTLDKIVNGKDLSHINMKCNQQ